MYLSVLKLLVSIILNKAVRFIVASVMAIWKAHTQKILDMKENGVSLK